MKPANRKAMFAELNKRTNGKGQIKMYDIKTRGYITANKKDCQIITMANGRRAIVAKHENRRLFRII